MATREIEVTVRGDKYNMAVEDDDSVGITRKRPGSPYAVAGRGYLALRPGEPERHANATKGTAIHSLLESWLRDGVDGGLSASTPIRCGYCAGRGTSWFGLRRCPACDGWGVAHVCETCEGLGAELGHDTCGRCLGYGHVPPRPGETNGSRVKE